MSSLQYLILSHVIFQFSHFHNCKFDELHWGVDGEAEVEADGASEVGEQGAGPGSISLLVVTE